MFAESSKKSVTKKTSRKQPTKPPVTPSVGQVKGGNDQLLQAKKPQPSSTVTTAMLEDYNNVQETANVSTAMYSNDNGLDGQVI